MRINGSYPSPVMGVSTLADRNRVEGFAEVQTNFRSDPLRKLVRRPSVKWLDTLLQEDDYDYFKGNFVNHSYVRNGVEYRLLVEVNKFDTFGAAVYGFRDGVPVTVNGDLRDYAFDWATLEGDNDWALETIENTTYILNRNKVAELVFGSNDLNVIERVSHVNVLSALNYGETVQINITKSDNTRHSISYTIPDLGDPYDYDTADKARATKQVALELAARINSGGVYPTGLIPNPDFPDDPLADTDWVLYCNPYKDNGGGGAIINPDFDDTQSVCKPYQDSFTGVTGVTAVALGSSIAIWEDGRSKWLEVEVETGQGDRSCVAFNSVTESVSGLPLYAVVGARIQVRPDPTTENGTYYLQAERIADDANGEVLEEVVWSESRSILGNHEIDQTTMPYICTWDEDTEEFTVTTGDYRDRLKGDTDTVKDPKFIGKRINDIGYFQKRLVFISGNDVTMSETDDLQNFWKQSAVQLLATDPISIASSATNVDELKTVTTHNRDLLLGASNAQFKIDGRSAVTPQTVSMPQTTSYEAIADIKPVSIGNTIYFPIDYGDSSGIKEYTGERETDQDIADSITGHVIGYIQGTVEKLIANANLNMLAVTTNDGTDNTIYVYEFKRANDGSLIQSAWSTWVLPESTTIVDIEFIQDKLTILTVDAGNIVRKQVEMYSKSLSSLQEVYLDDLVEVETDGLTATLPTEYNTEDMVVIRGEGTDYELEEIDYTLEGSILTLDEDIGAGKLIIGKKFTSLYRPTRPFRYEEDGSVITTDKLRINKFNLSVVDTNRLAMRVLSDYYTPDDQVFNSRFTGDISNLVGVVPKFTGDVNFTFANNPDIAKAEFYCDNHLGCNIIDINWEGQYHQSARRM